jgi:hypothetical protein
VAAQVEILPRAVRVSWRILETIKNTDGLCLEVEPGSIEIAIDFNYAYNPSCAYDPHWACPLAPRENWLEVLVEAGEMTYQPQSTL